MKIGTVIFLNGTSSSGKSVLIKGLQDTLSEPYLELGLDKCIWMLPKRYHNQPLWNEILGKAHTAGALGHQLVHGMHRAIRAMADSGLNILADHVLVENAWVRDCAHLFHDIRAYLIGVRCELTILEQREKDRQDRTLGQARAQYKKVHGHAVYDFKVDTGKYSLDQNIQQIVTFIKSNTPPEAFKQLLKS